MPFLILFVSLVGGWLALALLWQVVGPPIAWLMNRVDEYRIGRALRRGQYDRPATR